MGDREGSKFPENSGDEKQCWRTKFTCKIRQPVSSWFVALDFDSIILNERSLYRHTYGIFVQHNFRIELQTFNKEMDVLLSLHTIAPTGYTKATQRRKQEIYYCLQQVTADMKCLIVFGNGSVISWFRNQIFHFLKAPDLQYCIMFPQDLSSSFIPNC